jgi:hypothetical protein
MLTSRTAAKGNSSAQVAWGSHAMDDINTLIMCDVSHGMGLQPHPAHNRLQTRGMLEHMWLDPSRTPLPKLDCLIPG